MHSYLECLHPSRRLSTSQAGFRISSRSSCIQIKVMDDSEGYFESMRCGPGVSPDLRIGFWVCFLAYGFGFGNPVRHPGSGPPAIPGVPGPRRDMSWVWDWVLGLGNHFQDSEEC